MAHDYVGYDTKKGYGGHKDRIDNLNGSVKSMAEKEKLHGRTHGRRP